MELGDRPILLRWTGLRCNNRFHGVMVSTPDSESGNPSSNLGGTFVYLDGCLAVFLSVLLQFFICYNVYFYLSFPTKKIKIGRWRLDLLMAKKGMYCSFSSIRQSAVAVISD